VIDEHGPDADAGPMGEGRIIEHGSQDQLMERAGTYAELFILHAAAFGLEARQSSPAGQARLI